MALTVQAVLGKPELNLKLLTGSAGIDRRIRWAHVSELSDPTPWLQGGELLLTTGMQIPDDDEGSERYIRRLSVAGVSALGLSTGPSLSYSSIPASLVAAANTHALPLIHVPHAVPLEAIVQVVAHALEDERNEPFRRAFKAQQALTSAAVSADAVAGIVRALSKATGIWVMARDVRTAELSSSSVEAQKHLAYLLPRLLEERTRSLRAASSSLDDSESSVILPLGVGDGPLRGFLLAATPERFTSFDRILLAGSVALLSLELEHRHLALDGLRRQRSTLLDWLARAPVNDSEATARLQRLEIHATTVQAVLIDLSVAEPAPSGWQRRRASLIDLVENVLFPADCPVLVREHADGILAIVFDPPLDVKTRLSAITDGVIGVGAVNSLGNVSLSIRQATHAAEAAKNQGLDLLEIGSVGDFCSLIQLGNRALLAIYADSILGPLDAHDLQNGRVRLLPTLRKTLMEAGSAEGMATALGVHRHTLRQRLLQIEKLTGRSLSSPRDRMELSLALEVRAFISN